MDSAAPVNPFRSPNLMIAPLDTTVHLHKLHAPDPGVPSWSLEASMGPQGMCHTEQNSSSADTVPIPDSAFCHSHLLTSSAKSELARGSLQENAIPGSTSARSFLGSRECLASAARSALFLCKNVGCTMG